MAKTKVTKNDAKALAIVARPVDIQSNVDLDFKLNMDNLVNLVRVEARDKLVEIRSDVQAKLTAANTHKTKLDEQLIACAKGVCKDLENHTEANAVVAALRAFAPESAWGVLLDDEVCDVKKQEVAACVNVCRNPQDKNRGYPHNYGFSVVTNLTVKRPFTEEMRQVSRDIAKTVDEINELNSKLRQVNGCLADLPNLVDRANAELTKSYLRGELGKGDMVVALLGGIAERAVPKQLGCE